MEIIILGSVTPDATVCSSLGIGGGDPVCECYGSYAFPVCPSHQCPLNL